MVWQAVALPVASLGAPVEVSLGKAPMDSAGVMATVVAGPMGTVVMAKVVVGSEGEAVATMVEAVTVVMAKVVVGSEG